MGTTCFGRFFGRHEFIIRRLHSLTGVVFVSGYLAFHLVTNAAVLDGPATYQRRADQIHAVGPTSLFFLEWGLVLLPILFHGLIGIVIVTRGKRNLLRYPYSGNIRYTLQRVTGVLAFAFILWHVFQMRGWLEILWWREHITRQLGGALFDYRNAAETAHRAIAASPIIIAAYVVGVLVSVYHLGNGLWTAGSTWGVWTTPPPGDAPISLVRPSASSCSRSGWAWWQLRVRGGATGEVASAAGRAAARVARRWRQKTGVGNAPASAKQS